MTETAGYSAWMNQVNGIWSFSRNQKDPFKPLNFFPQNLSKLREPLLAMYIYLKFSPAPKLNSASVAKPAPDKGINFPLLEKKL
jgi:hypothetical protein